MEKERSWDITDAIGNAAGLREAEALARELLPTKDDLKAYRAACLFIDFKLTGKPWRNVAIACMKRTQADRILEGYGR